MRRLIIAGLAATLLNILPAFAGDYTVTLTQRREAALEWKASQDTLTLAVGLQKWANAMADIYLQQMMDQARKGLNFEPGQIIGVPGTNIGLNFTYETPSGVIYRCYFALGNGTAALLLEDTQSKCSATKDTASRFNVYWDVTNARYEMQNTFAVEISVIVNWQ